MLFLKLFSSLAFVCTALSVDYSAWEVEDNGGHSREFRSLHSDLDWDSLIYEEAEYVHRNRRATISARNTDEEITKFIQSHQPVYELLKKHFIQKFHNTWMNISSRIKNFDSLKSKLINKNYTIEQINDVIGFRFTLPTVTDVRKLKVELENDIKAGYEIVEIRCYGICKNAKETSRDGYRRIHFLIRNPEYNRTAELQLGTPYTNFWADWSHDFSYKGELGSRYDVKRYVIAVGDYLYHLDKLRDNTTNCPKILVDEGGFGVPGDNHIPPNICFHWIDIDLVGNVPKLLSDKANNLASIQLKGNLPLLILVIISVLRVTS